MKNKKSIFIALLLTLVISITSCGSDPSRNPVQDVSEESSVSSEESSKETESSESSLEESVDAKPSDFIKIDENGIVVAAGDETVVDLSDGITAVVGDGKINIDVNANGETTADLHLITTEQIVKIKKDQTYDEVVSETGKEPLFYGEKDDELADGIGYYFVSDMTVWTLKFKDSVVVDVVSAGNFSMNIQSDSANINVGVDGVDVQDGQGNGVTVDGNGINVQDSEGNGVTIDEGGISIQGDGVDIQIPTK